MDKYLTLVVAHLGEIELLQVTAKIPQPDQIFWSTKDNDWSVAVTELPVLAYLKGHHVGEAVRGIEFLVGLPKMTTVGPQMEWMGGVLDGLNGKWE